MLALNISENLNPWEPAKSIDLVVTHICGNGKPIPVDAGMGFAR